MADPFSIVASSFAVVGVADVVLRVGVECCRFLSEIKDAPAEIDRLQTCIKENVELVDTLNKHLDDLRDPASSMSLSAIDSSSALDGFNSSIRAIHRELNGLQALAKKYSRADRTWARVKWVLDGRKISKSLEKLERSKSTLSVALSLVEGRRSTSGQKSTDAAVQQSFQQITSKMDFQLQELSTVRASQEKLLSRQEQVILHSAQQLKKTGLLRNDLLKATRIDRTEHAKTRRNITDGNRKVINTISSKLDNLRISIPRAPIVAAKSNRKIHFIGERRESILTPLVLMKDHVRWAILHVLSHHVERVSPQHLYWLQSEFDKLVSSATQEAAAFYQGSTATPFDQWNYSTGVNTFLATDLPSRTTIARDSCKSDDRPRTRSGSYETVHQRGLRSDYEVFSSSSPVGQLRLTVPRTPDAGKFARNIEEGCLSFIPSMGICSNSISARFVKSINPDLEPRLYTQLNTFRLVEDYNPHMELFANGSIQDIDAAFRNGIISPYDQEHSGHIICTNLAAGFLRPEVLRYLDSQGVGQSNLNGGLGALNGFWDALQESRREVTYDSFPKVQAYFDGNTTICTSNIHGSLLHSHVWSLETDFPGKFLQLIKTWMEFLKRNGYDFELQNKWGRTPLLDHSSKPGGKSLAMVRLLLEFGANSQAVDLDGRNAIHLAICSSTRLDSPDSPKTLEKKLSSLIEAGVDLQHCDRWGDTPSHYARRYKCWAVWCRALERNGRTIDEVVREDGELWLLEESSEEESDEEESVERENEDQITSVDSSE